MITDYKIIHASSLNLFQSMVCQAIKDGWQPIGGMTIDSNTSTSYYQAMVKYSLVPALEAKPCSIPT